MAENKPTLLVTGASGHLGRRVIELLLDTDAGSIIATTRNPEKLADLVERGVTVRQADFDDPSSLSEAFTGADRLLLISTDALGEPGKRIQQHQNAVTAAQKAGIQHVVYTSIIEPTNTPVMIAPDHAATEEALEHSTMDWTILRNNLYMDLLLTSLPRAFEMGTLYSAAGDGKAAYITREDCAKVAAAALASSFTGRRTLDVTGSIALSQAEIAATASSIFGKSLNYIPIPLEAMIQGMVDAGLPHPLAESFASFDTGIAQGKFSGVSNVVEELTGEKAISLADFLQVNQGVLA